MKEPIKNISVSKNLAKSRLKSVYCCPVCGERVFIYQFTVHNMQLERCSGCGIISNVLTENKEGYVDVFYGKGSEINITPPQRTDNITEQIAAIEYLKLLGACEINTENRMLLVAPPNDIFTSEAEKAGWHITQQHITGKLKTDFNYLNHKFDVAVILYQLEKSLNPDQILQKIYAILKPGGILLVVTPSLNSTSAQFFGRYWTEWRPENRFFFDKTTIQLLLWRTGFKNLIIQKDRRKYTLSHIHNRAKAFQKTWITRFIKAAYNFVPSPFRSFRFRLPSSGMIIKVIRGELHEPQICSIIIPAYNESETFPILMDAVIAKQMPGGMDKEIIIVESNSKDDTRKQVLKYKDRPGVKIIFQEKARGKGNAVRAGFEQATGDILFIQDADLEYDLNDLDALLEPIIKYQVPFVLGSRHGGKWKMREFDGEEGLSTFFNFGHFLFTTLLNTLYGQHLKDPFTMYKIFRRDCIYGLTFESNRFDFDFELVIKLIRKGYIPVEIPVNYRSRSYKEGKKVRVFRDPLTWIWALIKYRFEKL